MTIPSVPEATRWIELGNALCDQEIRRLAAAGEAAFTAPSALPHWSRGHVVAHLIGNGEGITRLLGWAATGSPAPMYPSRESRNADIEERSRWAAAELLAGFVAGVVEVSAGIAAMPSEGWSRVIVAGQNRDGGDRVVPARVVPWMRAREVMVHAVDLDAGVSFADLPQDFLRALADDIVAKRRTEAASVEPVLVSFRATDTDWSAEVPGPNDWSNLTVEGSLADLTAYLAGRRPLDAAPTLSAWL